MYEVNGVDIPASDFDGESLSDTDQIKVTGGYVWQEFPKEGKNADMGSYETFIKKWRKAQTTVYLNVAVHKDNFEAVKAAIIAAGGKIA
jgi:hypothetical protein